MVETIITGLCIVVFLCLFGADELATIIKAIKGK